jgi:hypothetical protein
MIKKHYKIDNRNQMVCADVYFEGVKPTNEIYTNFGNVLYCMDVKIIGEVLKRRLTDYNGRPVWIKQEVFLLS